MSGFDRDPFDKSTLFGFCAILTCNFVWSIIYLGVTIVISSLFLTMALFFNAFCIHFGSMFQHITVLADKHGTDDNEIQLKSSLIVAMNLHNEAKG